MNIHANTFSGSRCKDNLRELLEQSEHTLEKEGVLDQIIKLEDWIDSCNRSQSAAYRYVSDGLASLHELRDRLNQKADDLIRLEGEGGLPSTPEQEQDIAELSGAVKRIDYMIDLIEGTRAA